MTTTRSFEIGSGLRVDIDRLIASRLLVQANSGGGKTRTLRRLLEQTHGRVQHLVIDPEGEYHTLREKFDYVLAAPKGGDTVAHPRTAKLLAERLLQLGVSAILDIYELNPDARQAFVKGFLHALTDAPRELWHPALVVLDEAHVYAPEGKESESTSAVKAMASRGRKRGFCLVPATQRLAKLSKDVAAECNNKLVGRCTLDVDIKRAAEELGFTTNEQKQGLRQLEPGQFFAFGPAFDVREPKLVLVGSIVTSHPEPGQQAAPVPPPTDKVRKVLQQLADLPAEAEAREKSIDDLKRDNASLRRQLTEVQKAQPAAPKAEPPRIIEKPVVTDTQLSQLEQMIGRLDGQIDRAAELLSKPVVALRSNLVDLVNAVKSVRQPALPLAPPRHTPVATAVQGPRSGVRPDARTVRPAPRVNTNGTCERLPAGEKATLIAAAQYPDGITREQASILTGYKRSSRDAYIQRLKERGYVAVVGDRVVATDDGVAALGPDYEPLPVGEELQAYWLNRLPAGEKAVLEALLPHYPHSVSREAIDEATGYKRSSRDAYIQRLKARQLVAISSTGVQASAVLFEE
jgi:uncharacterized protein